MARILIMPVDAVDLAVWSPAQVDRAEVLVAGNQEVIAPRRRERRAVRLQDVLLDRAAVNAAEDHAVAILSRHDRRVERDQAAWAQPLSLWKV